MSKRPSLTVPPVDYFAKIGGAEVSPAEKLLVENFRQMNEKSRAILMDITTRIAASDRKNRMEQTAGSLRLVKGGA